MRGDITIWLSADVIKQWHIADRTYDNNGAPHLYSDMARMAWLLAIPSEKYASGIKMMLWGM